MTSHWILIGQQQNLQPISWWQDDSMIESHLLRWKRTSLSVLGFHCKSRSDLRPESRWRFTRVHHSHHSPPKSITIHQSPPVSITFHHCPSQSLTVHHSQSSSRRVQVFWWMFYSLTTLTYIGQTKLFSPLITMWTYHMKLQTQIRKRPESDPVWRAGSLLKHSNQFKLVWSLTWH